MVYSGQSLFVWHTNRDIYPNEKLNDVQKKRVGYFVLHDKNWLLVNEGMPDLLDVKTKTPVPIGGNIVLTEGLQLLLSKESDGRLVIVQMVGE